MVHQINGNLIENVKNGFLDYAVHQVNCRGVMKSGIAKSIRAEWPQVYIEYWDKIATASKTDLRNNLGSIQLVPVIHNEQSDRYQYVINFFSQDNYGHACKRYTSYDAFWDCLNQLIYSVPEGAKIGFPKGIGCGLGNGNWNVIHTMIQEVLGQHFDVYIYNLGGN